MAENANEGFVIPDELLEHVAGGAMTESEKEAIRPWIRIYRGRGCTLEETLQLFDDIDWGSDYDEFVRFVTDYYNQK